MRFNLSKINVDVFLEALRNLGWTESQNERSEFRKDAFHLTIRKRRYCLLHKDQVRLGHHGKPVTKGDELQSAYHEIIEEYKRIRSFQTVREKNAV